MSSATWQQPAMVNLMGMTMSENKIESAAANTQESNVYSEVPKSSVDEVSKTNVDPLKKPRPHGVSSSLPLFDEDAYVDARDPSKTKLEQVKRILGNTWVRLVLIIGGILTTLFLIVFIRGMGDEQVRFNFGETTSIEVNTEKTGRDNLNKEQAAYLMELQREEARRKARAGESSAAVIELPKASVDDINLAEQTQLVSIDTQTTDRYAAEKARQEALRAAIEAQRNENKLNLSTNTGRYKEVGSAADGSGYYVDQQTNQIVVPPPAVSSEELYERQLAAQRQMAPTPPRSSQQGTYNTQYNGSQGQGGNQYPQDNNNYGGANNGGQGGASAPDSEQAANQRQPDPDLPIIQQKLYDSYEQQMAEQQAYAARLEEQRRANLERAQAIEQNRRQLAAQAFAEQVQRIEQGTKSGRGGYSSQLYYQPESNNPEDSDNQGVSADPNFNGGFSPISYNSNGYNNLGYVDPVAGGAYGSTNVDKDGFSTPKPKPLPRNIVRAGTSWPVVVTKSINTDEGLQVVAQVMGGPFQGSEVYGVVTPTGRDIGINFTSIVPPNPRMPIVPVNAMAVTIGSQKQAVSSHRNNHYIQNYSVMAAESIIEGYGDAYSNQNETVIERGDGTIITSKGETTKKEVRANILSQFADRLNKDVAKLGDRAPTYYVRQGTVLQMKLLSNMDMHQTANDIGGAGRTSL